MPSGGLFVADDVVQPVGGDRRALALQVQRLHRVDADRAAHEAVRRLPDEDLVLAGRLLEPRGGVQRVAGQDLLIKTDNTTITGKDTLKGKKVCSVTGSTPAKRIKDEGLTEASNVIEFQGYSQCVTKLLEGEVDAVTTDDAILKGYAAAEEGKLKVVGKTFSSEPYGIGLPKEDKALRDKVNDILQASLDDGTWQKIYDGTLGKSGSAAQKPTIDRY